MKQGSMYIPIFILLATVRVGIAQLTPQYSKDPDEDRLSFQTDKPWLWQKKKMPAQAEPWAYWQEWRRQDCVKILRKSPWVASSGIGEINGESLLLSGLIGTAVKAQGVKFTATILCEPVVRAMVRLKQIDQRLPIEAADAELKQRLEMLNPGQVRIAINMDERELSANGDPFKRYEMTFKPIDFGLDELPSKCFLQKDEKEESEFLRAVEYSDSTCQLNAQYFLNFENQGFFTEQDKTLFLIGNFKQRLKIKFKVRDMVINGRLYL